MPSSPTEARLSVPAEIGQMATLRRFVEETALGWGADPDELADVVLAVDELGTNTALYGYQARPGHIEAVVRRVGPDLTVLLRDRAPTFDPRSVPPPDLTLPIEERPIGGLGLHLVRHMVDDFEHRARAGGGNEITLTKRAVFR